MGQRQFHGDRDASKGRALHALQMKRSGWKLGQIAVVLGVSRSRAWQIIATATDVEQRKYYGHRQDLIAKQQRANAAVLDGLTKLRIITPP